MRLKLNKIKLWVMAIVGVATLGLAQLSGVAYAEGYGINMSPLNQKIVLNPGEKYTGTFTIANPQDNAGEFKYKVTVNPFFVDEDYNIYYEKTEGLNQIVDWITLDTTSGTLPLGDHERINFTVNVPLDAPAGGQYAAITVSADDETNENTEGGDSVGMNLNQSVGMAQIIYAEIAGTTRHGGEVVNTSLPSFLFNGKITAESTIKNTGNTHDTATYKMQIFPLFSGEEVYTTEESPETKTILPNRTLTNKTTWEETPAIGIFNVKYSVEFDGVTTEITKMVIICPLWLLFIIIFVIIAIITWLVFKAKSRKKSVDTE